MDIFNKYSVLNVYKIPLIDSTLWYTKQFLQRIKKIEAVKSQNEEKKQKKITVLTIASWLYDE